MFEVYGAKQNEGKFKSDVDWDKLNRYVVDTCALQERETLVGVISVIVDLGVQTQLDAELEFKGTLEDEAKIIQEMPGTYFKDGVDQQTGKKVRLKCWKQKSIQSVVIAVDFPEILLDKGQFFGKTKSKPLPLRLWLGGSFYVEGSGVVVARPIPLKVTKGDKGWTFSANHQLYKMALGAKLIQAGEPFLPKDIDKLLGKALQFEVQVFFKESKGKGYYNEYIKFVSGLGRSQSSPELLTTPYLVQFNKVNPEEAVKELRNHVINTIKRAENYEGSVIQSQIEALRSGDKVQEVSDDSSDNTPNQEEPKASKPVKPASRKPVPVEDIDDDSPF